MKPNLFHNKKDKNEDHFTNTLAYILNLFPETIGNSFLAKLAVQSGNDSNFFGIFKEAVFTGHEFLDEKSDSKPDMIILTDKTRLLFEVKLDAPLGEKQLERHYSSAARKKSYLILVSNKSVKVSTEILKKKYYIKPTRASHFLWTDIEPVFSPKFIKNKVERKLLADFRQSLQANGVKCRQIAGYAGNLYENGSDAENFVLDTLKVILKDIGFSAWRPRREYTLRVNPEKPGQDPLLNPRFYPSGDWVNERCNSECMIINCFEKGVKENEAAFIYNLKGLSGIYPDFFMMAGYLNSYHRAFIYIPLKFCKEANNYNLDWKYISDVWGEIYRLLKLRKSKFPIRTTPKTSPS